MTTFALLRQRCEVLVSVLGDEGRYTDAETIAGLVAAYDDSVRREATMFADLMEARGERDRARRDAADPDLRDPDRAIGYVEPAGEIVIEMANGPNVIVHSEEQAAAFLAAAAANAEVLDRREPT